MLSSVASTNIFGLRAEVQLALSDSCCMQILSSVTKKAKTVSEISDDLGFSISKVHRKIHLLKKANLVRISGDISNDGCKRFRYLSRMNHSLRSILSEQEEQPGKTISNEVKFNGT